MIQDTAKREKRVEAVRLLSQYEEVSALREEFRRLENSSNHSIVSLKIELQIPFYHVLTISNSGPVSPSWSLEISSPFNNQRINR